MFCGSGHDAFGFNQWLLVATVVNGMKLSVVTELYELTSSVLRYTAFSEVILFLYRHVLLHHYLGCATSSP